jgi:hypothetical protein
MEDGQLRFRFALDDGRVPRPEALLVQSRRMRDAPAIFVDRRCLAMRGEGAWMRFDGGGHRLQVPRLVDVVLMREHEVRRLAGGERGVPVRG